MFENFHDYIFRVKCNNTPAMTVRLVAVEERHVRLVCQTLS